MSDPIRSTVLRDVASEPVHFGSVADLRLAGAHVVVPGTASLGPQPRANTIEVDADHLEQIEIDARVRGHEEGFAAGIAEAEEAAAELEATYAERVQQAVFALTSAVDSIDQREAVEWGAVAELLCRAAFDLTAEIVGRELAIDPEPARTALHRALVAAPEGRDAVARLHPLDAEVLGVNLESGQPIDIRSGGRVIRLSPDERITQGDCIIELGNTLVDARISTALERVREALLGQESSI